MAEILSEQYSSVFSQPRLCTEETEKLFTERRPIPLSHYLWDINFSEEDLKEAMSEVPIISASAPGPRLNIKTVLSTYGDFHVKDKTAVKTSYL